MAQRRSITHHPAFVPFVAVWSAALFGLAVAVLPGGLVGQGLTAAGLADIVPAGEAAHAAAAVVAAFAGGLAGLIAGRAIARRGRPDPRPIFRDEDLATGEEQPAQPAPLRRPLRVREDLEANETAATEADIIESESLPPRAVPVGPVEAAEGFMILTPQPIHPRPAAVDLDTLLEQFDHAIAGFQSDSPRPRPAAVEQGPDPVHSFVARQTGAPAPSPLGGLVPDHQAELRTALDKLAKAMRER